jgi:hypothetical protein
MELLGQGTAYENSGLQLLGRRVELGRHHPIRRRQPALHAAFPEAPGQTMGQQALGPEPAQDG